MFDFINDLLKKCCSTTVGSFIVKALGFVIYMGVIFAPIMFFSAPTIISCFAVPLLLLGGVLIINYFAFL